MKLNYENVMRDYSEHYGAQFSASHYQVFSTIAQHHFGEWDTVQPIGKEEVFQKTNISKRTIMLVVKTLRDIGIIKAVPSIGGRGKRVVFSLDMDTMKKLHSLETVKKIHRKKYIEKIAIDTVLNQGNNVDERAVENQVPASPVPPASVKRSSSSKPVNKRSSEEHDAFKATYAVFTDKRGEFEPGVKNREVKAIWQLIDKAKAVDPGNWVGLLTRVIAEFYRIKTSDRKEDSFLGKQPFLPSALNSPGIWPRVLENLRSTESKKPTEQDMRTLDLALSAIKG